VSEEKPNVWTGEAWKALAKHSYCLSPQQRKKTGKMAQYMLELSRGTTGELARWSLLTAGQLGLISEWKDDGALRAVVVFGDEDAE